MSENELKKIESENEEKEFMNYLTDYQNEIVSNRKSRTIICNWSRGLGKSWTLARIITDNRPKNVLYYDNISDRRGLRFLTEKIQEFIRYSRGYIDSIKSFTVLTDSINIKYEDGQETNIINLKTANLTEYKYLVYDYIMFNECLPFNIGFDCKQEVAMVTMNDYKFNLPRLYPNSFVSEKGLETNEKYNFASSGYLEKSKIEFPKIYSNEFDILNVPKEHNESIKSLILYNTKENMNEFLISAFIKLTNEYNNILADKNTVLTRQNLLNMILSLKDTLDKDVKKEDNSIIPLYFDVVSSLPPSGFLTTTIYYKDKIKIIDKVSPLDTAKYIKGLIDMSKDNIKIYSDCLGYSKGITDSLEAIGIKVEKLKLESPFRCIENAEDN